VETGAAEAAAAVRVGSLTVRAPTEAAGAVVVGLTRLPELGVFGATDSVFGVTRIPRRQRP
jgi:amidase